MKALFLVIMVFGLTGCITDLKQRDMEYRIKILEKRITILEMNIDELSDVCP